MNLSEINKFYLFISTSNSRIIAAVNQIEGIIHYKEIHSAKESYCRMFFNNRAIAGKNEIYYNQIINNQADYDLGSIQFNELCNLDEDYDTLLSYALINEKQEFIAGTDYLAVLNHYYYHDRETFICSNNLFVVANLIGASLSEESFFEALFFRFPIGQKTFFNKIYCLRPFQQLRFSLTSVLLLSNSVSYNDLLYRTDHDVFRDIESFFIKAAKNGKSTILSFSGGSDSMTILSILLHYGQRVELASFSGHDCFDTNRIINLSRKLGINLNFINTNENNVPIENDNKYIFITNGLSPSSHYYEFYNSIPARSKIFDGYSMMLGDWSDAFLFPPFFESLKGNSFDFVLDKFLCGFNENFKVRLKDYLSGQYSWILANADDSHCINNIKNYAIEFIPSRILAGVIGFSSYCGHENYSYFLSRKFINYINSNNFGITKTFSAKNDYPGYVANRIPLALIVKKMDSTIFWTNLDKGISFRDIMNSKWFVKFKREVFIARRKAHAIFNSTKIKADYVKKNIQNKNSVDEISWAKKYINDATVINKHAKVICAMFDKYERIGKNAI